MNVSAEAASRLKGFDLSELEKSKNVCLAIDGDFRIIYVNPAYAAFANRNDGPDVMSRFGVGTDFLAAIRGPQRDFYRDLLTQAWDSGKQLSQDYECSAPDLYREFRLLIYPAQEGRSALMEHSLRVTAAHQRQEVDPVLGEYLDDAGLLHQCGHCRRVRHIATERWDWCPPLMSYKETSHGLCPTCLDFYYPE
jgi:hypothetical protein